MLAASRSLLIGYRFHNPRRNLRENHVGEGTLRGAHRGGGTQRAQAYCNALEGDQATSAPGVTDPGGWGYSLANLTEIMFPCLDAAGARSVVEIGAYRGELTRELLAWAAGAGSRVTAVDPEPPDELLKLADEHSELELVRQTSHDALGHLPLPDALIIDSDHNYYTLTEELRLVDSRAKGAELPLLMFHDVGWPHARRDTYYVPERIPEEHRQPLGHDVNLAPWEPGVADRGLPFEWAARREGGPHNGVLTALEDFVGERSGLRLAVIPAFFGFGVLWHRDAPWAGAVASIVDPWDRNPVLARLEANRVTHLAARHGLASELKQTRGRVTEQEKLLRPMLESRAFAVAEQLSRLHKRGRPAFSRQQVRRALGEDDGPG
jgi:Methyltransferase domain